MSNFQRFTLGRFTAYTLADNKRSMSFQDVFPSINPAELTAALQAAGIEQPEMEVGYNCLLVDTGERKILVDTGTGQGQLRASLNAAGFAAAAIDTVILTHGDGDHIGGVRGYPNARFVMTEEAWRLWTTPEGQRQMVQQFLELFRGKMDEEQLAAMGERRLAYGRDVLPTLRERVDLVQPESEFLPGFKLVAAPGHRSDHTAVEITSAGATLLHLVDGLRHPIQAMHPEWTSFIDSFPAQTAATNKKLLARAATPNALLFGAHLPFPALGRVEQTDAGFRWLEPAI